ncbi:MAG: phenylalanine 4-monooxygenase, partial [Pedobacter sp.]
IEGHTAILNFCSGLTLTGVVRSVERRNSRIILISFAGCSLKDERENIYFDPSWGIYDLAVGEKVVSVYCGAADKDAFEEIAPKARTATFHPEYDEAATRYQQLFSQVRSCRETQSGFERLTGIWEELKQNFRDDWLCAMEILEILEPEKIYSLIARDIRIYLELKASNEPELNKLIYNGLYLINKVQSQIINQ